MTEQTKAKRQRLSAQRKRAREIVARYEAYVMGYSRGTDFENYSEETLLNDFIYGVGQSLGPQFMGGSGFDAFKEYLRQHLGPSTEPIRMPESILPTHEQLAVHARPIELSDNVIERQWPEQKN